MSKKNFKANIATGADRFFSVHDEAGEQDVRDVPGVQDVQDTLPVYRINLKLRGDFKAFLAEEAWRQRKSVTALLNDMIEEYKEKVEAESPPA